MPLTVADRPANANRENVCPRCGRCHCDSAPPRVPANFAERAVKTTPRERT